MDRTEQAYSAWFQKINYIGAKTMFALKHHFGSMKEAYEASGEQIAQILNNRQKEALQLEKQGAKPRQYLANIEKQGIRYIDFYDEIYPDRLKRIPDPPYGLFVKGSLPEAGKPSVAIIGARACSEYGRQVAEAFSMELAAYDVQIISGMARGIDSISQKACIRAGGHTFAVLGNGVDICYPEELQGLYQDIQTCGGLISTYAPGMPPVSQNFPPRNRIISGLADVILVIESRKKSGTLITVDMALEQGKEVAVVPGRITDRLSEGCHQLIKQGANVVMDTEQLMELLMDTFSLQNHLQKTASIEHNREEKWIHIINRQDLNEAMKEILKILSERPTDYMTAEDIFVSMKEKGSQISFQELMENMLDLELMDLCKSNKNRFIIR